MGFIRDDFGPFAIESRRESFYIHANYGYKPSYKPIDQLPLGGEFVWDDARWRVTLLSEDRVEAREQQFSTIRKFDPAVFVEVPGFEEDAEGPFARNWRELPHPEFLTKDLDDLIAALQDYKESL